MSNKGSLVLLKPNEARKANYIELDEQQVKTLRFMKIKEWPNWTDVWSITYGIPILMATTSITSAFFLRHRRIKFKLEKYGLISNTMTVVVMPAVLSSTLHYETFTSGLLGLTSENLTECILCKEIRTSMGYVGISTVVPAALSWLGGYASAYSSKSYAVPELLNSNAWTNKRERKVLFKDLKKVFMATNKDFSNLFLKCLCVQFLVVTFVAYFQMRQFFYLEDKLVFDQSDLATLRGSKKKELDSNSNIIRKIRSYFKKE